MGIKLNDKYQSLFTSDKRYSLLTGGRGSSKSFTVSTFLLLLMYETGHRILFTRWTMVSADISIIPEFLEKIELLGVSHQFEVTKTEIRHKVTGSEILFRGIKTSSGIQTASLKSLHGITTWVIDEAEEVVDEKLFNKIAKSIRKAGVQNRIILILNPTTREHWIWKRWFEKTHTTITVSACPVSVSTHSRLNHIHSTYLDNIDNLDAEFLENEVYSVQREDPQGYAHEIIGGWQMQPDGVLYTESELKRFSKADVRLDEAECIYGYGDIADEGTDSLCFPIGYVFRNKVFITEVVFSDEDVTLTLPSVVSAIKAQTHYDKDKRIKKQMDWVRIESNGQGSLFIKMLRQYIDAGKILATNHATNKLTRIKNAKRFVVNHCYFLRNEEIVPNSDYDKFMKGVLSFLKDGSSEHDDAPDGLSGLAVMCESFNPELFDPLPIDVF